MEEIVVNIHMHTRYSDGSGSHKDIAVAALRSGLDAVIITDHNILVRGMAGYFRDGPRRVLVVIGEEVHDQARDPQKNHLLVFGMEREVAELGDDPAHLIQDIAAGGGLSFIAHLTDPAAPAFNEEDLSWVDWSVDGFTGIELWNGLSELKTVIPNRLSGILHAFFPALVARGPPPASLHEWDRLASRRAVVAIGGSDAHALHVRLGPLSRVVYPYGFHFRAINTHLLIPEPLTGDPHADQRTICDAIALGHCFVGYDLPHSTRGFRFSAHTGEAEAVMGEEVPARGGVTLRVELPSFAELRLMRDGRVIHVERRAQALTYRAGVQPGVYRVEAYRPYLGRKRGWIFSNPIYVR